MAASMKETSKTIEDKMKLWLILLNKFINERNPREKQMIIALGFISIVFFDYWILIHPVIRTYVNISSQSAPLETELKGLNDDQKNRKFIDKNLSRAKTNLETSEKRFIAPDEMPMLLENLSKLALDSGVKVMSLQPLENPKKNTKKGSVNPYPNASILLRATAGTHEFGKFLSLLENNPTFIRVKDVKIYPNSQDDHRHMLELNIEVYRKEALS